MGKREINWFLKVPPKLGDAVLAEPVLRSVLSQGYKIFLDGPYSKIFSKQGWPEPDPELPSKSIDALRISWECDRNVEYLAAVREAGIQVDLVTPLPRIDNIEPVEIEDDAFRIGIIHKAGETYKEWKGWKTLCRNLLRVFEVHAFDATQPLRLSWLNEGKRRNLINHVGLSLLELMQWFKSMNLVVSNDTGPAHLAAALGVPTIVVYATNDLSKLYLCYGEIVSLVKAPENDLRCLSARTVFKEIRRMAEGAHIDLPVRGNHPNRIAACRTHEIAIMRMDGLGGTVSILDQAAKIHRATGHKVTLVTRGFEPLLLSHPSVAKVRNLKGVDWFEALRIIRDNYDALADVRIAVGKWYGKGSKMFPDTSDELDEYYYTFHSNMVDLEKYGMHQIELADKVLGLPCDSIEAFTYADDGSVRDWISGPYMLITTGVDAWHEGGRQVKQWPHWEKLVKEVSMQTVHVGTRFDPPVEGCIDLRGKTNLLQLAGLIRRAKVIVCTEGGIMHLAYACKHPRTIVLRGPTQGKLFEYPGQVCVDAHTCGPCWSKAGDWTTNCMHRLNVVCMETIGVDRVAYHVERLAA